MDALWPWWQGVQGVDAGLWALFALAFAAATVLPASSEVGLAAFVLAFPAQAWLAFAVATLGNVLGSAFTWAMGRGAWAGYVRWRGPQSALAPAWAARLQRWGPPALFFAFVPVVGDALVLAAGGLGWAPGRCLLWLALGKAARYLAVVLTLLGLFGLSAGPQ